MFISLNLKDTKMKRAEEKNIEITNKIVKKHKQGKIKDVLKKRQQEQFNILKTYCGLKGSLLDLGSRDGLWLNKLKCEGFQGRLVGIELSEEALKTLKEQGFEGYRGNIEKDLNIFTPGSFDIIWSSHVFEHCENPSKVVEDIKKILRPRGYLFVEVPLESKVRNAVGHFHMFNNRNSVIDLFNEFKIIHKYTDKKNNNKQWFRVLGTFIS